LISDLKLSETYQVWFEKSASYSSSSTADRVVTMLNSQDETVYEVFYNKDLFYKPFTPCSRQVLHALAKWNSILSQDLCFVANAINSFILMDAFVCLISTKLLLPNYFGNNIEVKEKFSVVLFTRILRMKKLVIVLFQLRQYR
jgi:hypothetical protein